MEDTHTTKESLIYSLLTMYRSINKVISLRNISKVFSHFYTLMAYVLLYMLFNSHAILIL